MCLPPDGWQQLAAQVALADERVCPGRQRRLSIADGVRQAHSYDVQRRRHRPKIRDRLQATKPRYAQANDLSPSNTTRMGIIITSHVV